VFVDAGREPICSALCTARRCVRIASKIIPTVSSIPTLSGSPTPRLTLLFVLLANAIWPLRTNILFDSSVCISSTKTALQRYEKTSLIFCFDREANQTKHLSALPSSAAAREYSCPVCKHAVVPEKWPLNSGVGAKIAAFLRRFPFGDRLLPQQQFVAAASASSSSSSSLLPSTPLRAAIMGASSAAATIETPKARSRKQNEGGDVRLTVGETNEDEDDKYANKRRWISPVRLFLLVIAVVMIFGCYVLFVRAAPLAGGSDPIVEGEEKRIDN
jgi:hypothetical protein